MADNPPAMSVNHYDRFPDKSTTVYPETSVGGGVPCGYNGCPSPLHSNELPTQSFNGLSESQEEALAVSSHRSIIIMEL